MQAGATTVKTSCIVFVAYRINRTTTVQTSQTLYSLWFGKGEQERGKRSSFMSKAVSKFALAAGVVTCPS